MTMIYKQLAVCMLISSRFPLVAARSTINCRIYLYALATKAWIHFTRARLNLLHRGANHLIYHFILFVDYLMWSCYIELLFRVNFSSNVAGYCMGDISIVC